MAKAMAPGTVHVPGSGAFEVSALPDPFDARDLEYRPRLRLLPRTMDARGSRHVMQQEGNSCVGHALAAMINTVLADSAETTGVTVSPYMMYRLARRYDEFDGEEDAGSSLRGGLKGWFYHGVVSERDWDALSKGLEPDLGDPGIAALAAERPLGAYYRINPYRLDDLQSAICELKAIVVSGVVHEGWLTPERLTRNGDTLHVITRPPGARSLGGHAYALVGYNEVGFLVQNSWGRRWGKSGFATLPYQDLTESVHDAWVARPGVPKTPVIGQAVFSTGRQPIFAAGPDLRRLDRHVINLGNEGRLSPSGAFASSPEQINRVFEHMDLHHRHWRHLDPQAPRHLLLYAHGGLNSEAHALRVAQENLNWWINNRVYPVFFAWQSGASETLVDQLTDALRGQLPFGFGFDLFEAVDMQVERFARTTLRWMWNQMKQNADAASGAIADQTKIAWPPTTPQQQQAMMAMPGVTLTALRLARAMNDDDPLQVHLVGHSAGSIFLAALLGRLAEPGIDVATLQFLAPAIRVDEFEQQVLPRIQDRSVDRFTTFALSDEREIDGTVGAGGVDVYHKSLLYLVSRALEGAAAGDEVPLLGMEKFFDRPSPGGATLRQVIAADRGTSIFAPTTQPADERSDATSHGGFSGDQQTMTSVMMRILGPAAAQSAITYTPNAQLNPRLVPDQLGISAEVADAPRRGAAILDMLQADGWQASSPRQETSA